MRLKNNICLVLHDLERIYLVCFDFQYISIRKLEKLGIRL